MNGEISNGKIAALLERHGKLLEVADESPFRARAFARAGEAVGLFPDHVSRLASEGRLREIPGVGEGIAAAITQIVTTGRFDAHDELTSRIPESLFELTTIPGVGAKTALNLFTSLGITDLASLAAALVAGRIGPAKGLGARVEATVRAGLETLDRRTGRTPLGLALPIARALVTAYEQVRPQDQMHIAGSTRRWRDTVGDLDFVIRSEAPSESIGAMAELPIVMSLERMSESACRIMLAGELAADVYLANPYAMGSTLVVATGNARHLERLGMIAEKASEEAVYAALGLPWIPPELRRGEREFSDWAEIASLVTVQDMHGEFHAHTTWSDGTASIEEMALAAETRGYEYLGITDHSEGLAVAGGLSIERLESQCREIAMVNDRGTLDVQLLTGVEVEVHRDGSLDYSDDVLASLDVVVASLHSGLRLPRAEQTARLERVLRNPNVDIIAHPSGRLIERREGGDFDWEQVFATAAVTGTALEINADPARLDLNWELAAQASAAGCTITINCDAHHSGGFNTMEYGIAVARRAWLKPIGILNCWQRERVLDWLAARG